MAYDGIVPSHVSKFHLMFEKPSVLLPSVASTTGRSELFSCCMNILFRLNGLQLSSSYGTGYWCAKAITTQFDLGN